MKKFQFTTFFSLQLLLLIVFFQPPVFAADYSDNISEEYLRSQFTFAAGDKLKYAECKKKSHPTCTYIWGAEHKKDAARLKAGVAPKGNKLQIVYAQAGSKKDFERVLSSYKDAQIVEGLAADAVWSQKRRQLSLITEDNLIMHINIDDKSTADVKARSVSIAQYILDK
jgi:hypothetical protein